MVDVCMQANHLKSETETYEEKEQQLVNDCVNELSKSLHFYLCLSFCFPVTIHIYIVIFLFTHVLFFHGVLDALDTRLSLPQSELIFLSHQGCPASRSLP